MPKSPLHPGAVEHYADAEGYEQRYGARAEDLEFYLRRCKKDRSIVEYGAGAGRLTLPLARAGHQVWAVDTSRPMLDLLKKRLKDEEPNVRRRVTVREGDMRTFSTKKRFDAVIAGFHTVCHLYSNADVAAFVQLAHRHLKPGGKLLFDLPLPKLDVPGYDPIAQVRVTEMDGRSGPELLTQRWYQPREIAMHLHYGGFRRIRLGSDYANAPIVPETSVFTVSATKPA